MRFGAAGSVGPEGSVLVLAVILLMLVWLLAVYGRGRKAGVTAALRPGGGEEGRLAASAKTHVDRPTPG